MANRNKNDLEYIGTLFMGENSEPVNVIFDTGSDWVVISSHKCNNCDKTHYDHSDEETFEAIPGSWGERNYGSAGLEGYEAYDTVCLKPDGHCANTFKWFVILSQ